MSWRDTGVQGADALADQTGSNRRAKGDQAQKLAARRNPQCQAPKGLPFRNSPRRNPQLLAMRPDRRSAATTWILFFVQKQL